MKSILSASICATAMAFAVPALAADKPMKHHMHHSRAVDHMQGPKTHSKRAGDPSTEDLNAKSLDAARGGAAPAGTMQAAPMTPPPAAGTGAMTPTNAPQGN